MKKPEVSEPGIDIISAIRAKTVDFRQTMLDLDKVTHRRASASRFMGRLAGSYYPIRRTKYDIGRLDSLDPQREVFVLSTPVLLQKKAGAGHQASTYGWKFSLKRARLPQLRAYIGCEPEFAEDVHWETGTVEINRVGVSADKQVVTDEPGYMIDPSGTFSEQFLWAFGSEAPIDPSLLGMDSEHQVHSLLNSVLTELGSQ